MYNDNDFGMTLRNARLQNNMTQEEAAELVKVCVETIRNIESGRTTPVYHVVLRLWNIYGLPKEKLWEYQNPAPKKIVGSE